MSQSSTELEVVTVKGPGLFTLTQLDGMRGTKLLIKLTKLLAPALADARNSDSTASKGLAALSGVLAALDPDEFERVAVELLSKAVARFPEADEVDEQAGKHLAALFQGLPLELLKLVGGALESNFPFVQEWIQGLKATAAKAMKGTEKSDTKSEEPKT
jgi:hypothetical protein